MQLFKLNTLQGFTIKIKDEVIFIKSEYMETYMAYAHIKQRTKKGYHVQNIFNQKYFISNTILDPI